MLTFQSLLDQTSGMDRTMMLAGKIEDMLNTVVRQIAFYQFELDLHNARQKGELSSADIGKCGAKRRKKALALYLNFMKVMMWFGVIYHTLFMYHFTFMRMHLAIAW